MILVEDSGQCSDTVYEILIRLPVKTLCRFRCACKSWYSLISHPSFHRDHYRLNSQRNPNLFVVSRTEDDDSGNLVRLHLSTYSNDLTNLCNFCKTISMSAEGSGVGDFPVCPVGSCLGLVCLMSLLGTTIILLCNPSTEELVTVPPPLNMGMYPRIGFGHGNSTRRLKVVLFHTCEPWGREENWCEIFTLGSVDGWRRSRNPPFFMRLGVRLFHGALHLMPEDSEEEIDDYIAVFDLDAEEYRKIRLPEIYFEKSDFQQGLSEISGSLCLGFETQKLLQLWCLKDYDSGNWVKEYSIDLSSEVCNYQYHYVVAVMGDGSLLMNVDNKKDGHALRLYNTHQNCFTQNIKNNYSGTFYVESLFAPRTEMSVLKPNW